MIQDKFTTLPVSRQRRYQLRQRAIRRCRGCGAFSGGTKFCRSCQPKERARRKRQREAKREEAGRLTT